MALRIADCESSVNTEKPASGKFCITPSWTGPPGVFCEWLSGMGSNVMRDYSLERDSEPVRLSEAQKARIAARSRRGLAIVLLAQAGSGLLASLLLWIFAGWESGLSALCGSMSYLAPNAVFVARLVLSTFNAKGSGPIVFLLGNGLKVVAAVVLLWALSRIDSGWVNWLAVVAGLVVTLKGYWVAVLLTGGRITKHM